MEGLINEYIDYLGSLVGGNNEYKQLFEMLLRREFYSPIDKDKNRAAYGLLLRNRFEYDAGLAGRELDILGPCRFLETLIALAENIDNDIMRDSEHPDRVAEWFWIMMDNCGLSQYSDRNWTYNSSREVDHIIDILLDHKYSFDCLGGLFPMPNIDVDMRQIELWYQAQIYFMDKN